MCGRLGTESKTESHSTLLRFDSIETCPTVALRTLSRSFVPERVRLVLHTSDTDPSDL